MSESPVVRGDSMVTQVYQSLRKSIVTRSLPAGHRLVESDIAKRYNVSRTPVREAIKKLESEGMLEALPNGGVAVTDVGAGLLDLYGLRQRLEGYAAFLAAARITTPELDQLATIADTYRAATSPLARARASNRFHTAILDASRVKQLSRLRDLLPTYFLDDQMAHLYDYDQITTNRIHEEHLLIVDALRRGATGEAERLTQEHFAGMGEIVSATWNAHRAPTRGQQVH